MHFHHPPSCRNSDDYRGPGTSTGTREEYVEIFNNGTTPISRAVSALKKMTKAALNRNLAAAIPFDAYTIAPQSFS